jgi:hypothetical protein
LKTATTKIVQHLQNFLSKNHCKPKIETSPQTSACKERVTVVDAVATEKGPLSLNYIVSSYLSCNFIILFSFANHIFVSFH